MAGDPGAAEAVAAVAATHRLFEETGCTEPSNLTLCNETLEVDRKQQDPKFKPAELDCDARRVGAACVRHASDGVEDVMSDAITKP